MKAKKFNDICFELQYVTECHEDKNILSLKLTNKVISLVYCKWPKPGIAHQTGTTFVSPSYVMRVWILLNLFILGSLANAQDPVSFEAISHLVESQGIQSIEELLPKLPKELLENYTLMHHSESAQGATPLNPRVILFSKNAKTIITFNGSHEQEGFNRLEFAQWRDDLQRLEMRFIEFPANKSSDKKAIISEVNPTECTSCHRSEPHWFWNRYQFWPGAYGETDDFPEFNAEEKVNYLKFREHAIKHPRYKFLASKYPMYPYQVSNSKRLLSRMPNARLGESISALNARRVLSIAKSSPLFPKYRHFLASLLTKGYLPLQRDSYSSCEFTDKKDPLGETITRNLLADLKLKYPNEDQKWKIVSDKDWLWPVLHLLGFETISDVMVETKKDSVMSRENPEWSVASYWDGSTSMDTILSDFVIGDLALENPVLKKFQKKDGVASVVKQYPELYDANYIEERNALGSFSTILSEKDRNEACEILRAGILKDLARFNESTNLRNKNHTH